MTVYTKSMMEALAEVRDIQEDNMDLMRKAAGGAMQTIKMKDGKLKMDSFTASAMMQVYDKVNDKNKKAMEGIINSGKRAQMVKLQSIAMKAIKSENDPEIEEEVELDEAKYDLYHKDFSSAMQHAYKMAKKLHGITVKSSEIDDKVASGPRKPSEGKTNKYRLEGDKGSIQVQVYNKGGSKPFELNMYKEEAELGEVAGTFTIVANGISDLKKADKQYLEDTQYSIAAGLAEDGVELDEGGVSYKGNSIMIPSDNEDMRMVQSWVKNQTKLAADTVKMIKPNMDYNDLYEERADHLYVAALLTKTAKPNRAPKYSVKFMKEETELDEGGVLGTEKTVTVIHKTSGKELEVTANSVKKYEKMGYKVVKEEVELEEGRMKELHGYIAQGKSAEWIAKKMGVDVKTIKSLMDGYGEVDEVSAYADAMKAMSKGRKVDPADVDTDATDADIKGASKNILAQMRKAVSLGGRFDVEFLDKKKVRVKPAIANAFVRKYEGMRRPADKEKFQNQAMKSYKDMLRVLKAGYNEEVELDEALPSHLKKHFDKDGNPKSKEGKAAWERLAKMKGYRKYTSKQIKMAVGIAFDKRFVQGNMTGAVNAIEKIAKGLSEIEPVRNALRRANENTILDRINRKLKERR